jgi:hypothetical protein
MATGTHALNPPPMKSFFYEASLKGTKAPTDEATTTRLRPARFASYSAESALRTRASRVFPSDGNSATPIEIVTDGRVSPEARARLSTLQRICSARSRANPGGVSVSTTMNSSPPKRAATYIYHEHRQAVAASLRLRTRRAQQLAARRGARGLGEPLISVSN